MIMRRSVISSTLTLFVVAAILLSACAPTVVPTAAPGANPTSAPAASEKVTLTYWSFMTEGEPLQAKLAETVAEYNAAHPNTTVNVTWVGRDVLAKVRTAMLSGNPPDIVDHSVAELTAGVIKENAALDLGPYLDKASPYYKDAATWRESFIPGFLEAFEGKNYYIPREAYTSAMFYNTGLFKDTGTNIPTTVDEFMAACKKFEAAGTECTAMDGTFPFFNIWWWAMFGIRQAGPQAFRDAVFDKTGQSWLTNPDFLAAAKLEEAFLKAKYLQEGFEGYQWPAAETFWGQGSAAMMLDGTWLAAEVSASRPEGFNFGIFPFPQIPGGKGNDYTEFWSNGFAVFKASKAPDAAVDFIQFALSKEQAEKMIPLGTPSAVVGVTAPAGTEGQFEMFKKAGADNMWRKWAGVEGDAAEYNSQVLWRVHDEFFFGKLTAQTFLEKLAAEQATYYAK